MYLFDIDVVEIDHEKRIRPFIQVLAQKKNVPKDAVTEIS